MILYGFHGFLGDLVPLAGFSIDFIEFNDFRWICKDFMDSWGPGSGGIWRHVARFCHGVWTLLLVCKIRSSDLVSLVGFSMDVIDLR